MVRANTAPATDAPAKVLEQASDRAGAYAELLRADRSPDAIWLDETGDSNLDVACLEGEHHHVPHFRQ